MTKISEALTYGLTIRESATDGSDFTNPAADYRRLFLGEDGQLHVKAESGTVTDIGVAAGGGPLGIKTYSSGANTAWASTASATPSDIDATNAALAITVPSSGNILVMIQVVTWTTIANGLSALWVRTGTTDLAGFAFATFTAQSGPGAGANNSYFQAPAWFYITGLTPGSLTIKAGFSASGGGGSTINVGANAGGAGNCPPFLMVAYAA
jgi:hypothetical protein